MKHSVDTGGYIVVVDMTCHLAVQVRSSQVLYYQLTPRTKYFKFHRFLFILLNRARILLLCRGRLREARPGDEIYSF